MKSVLHFPYAFVLMNWATVVGFYCFIRGGESIGQNIWTMPHHSDNHSATRHSERGTSVWASARQWN